MMRTELAQCFEIAASFANGSTCGCYFAMMSADVPVKWRDWFWDEFEPGLLTWERDVNDPQWKATALCFAAERIRQGVI